MDSCHSQQVLISHLFKASNLCVCLPCTITLVTRATYKWHWKIIRDTDAAVNGVGNVPSYEDHADSCSGGSYRHLQASSNVSPVQNSPEAVVLNTSHGKYFEKKECYSGQVWKMLDKALYTLNHVCVIEALRSPEGKMGIKHVCNMSQ